MIPLNCNIDLENGINIKYACVSDIQLFTNECIIRLRLFVNEQVYNDGKPEVTIMTIRVDGTNFDNYFSENAMQQKSIYDQVRDYLQTMSVFEPV